MSDKKDSRRGYCSVCGGVLTGGKPCAGGFKSATQTVFDPTVARAIAAAFVLSHKDSITGASPEEINEAIGKIGKVLWDLAQAQREAHKRGMV